MRSSKITILSLTFILIFAFVVRIYNISAVPSGFFCDEAERGVSAYSLIKTGSDWHGEPFPVFFEAFGEYTPPIQIYSMIPPIAIFGLNEFSVRLTSVLWGTAAVFLIFLLGTILVSQNVGLLSALFLAIQPWTLHYSRYGGEIMVYMTFFLFALILSLHALNKEKFWSFAFLVWGLTLYTYNPAKLITPLFLASFLVFNLEQIKTKKKYFLQGLAIFIIISLPFLFHMLSGAGFIRFQQVSIFSQDKLIVEKIWFFLTRYLRQFSPDYLFLKGDPTFITRHFTVGLTPLLLVQAILIPLGIIYLFRYEKNRKFIFLLLAWFIFYPIAGALTASGPLSSRSVIGAPLFAVFSGCGIILITKWLARQRKVWLTTGVTASLLVLVLINFFSFYIIYLNEYPKRSADFWGWQYGPREIVTYFQQVENQYDELIMSNRFNAPEIFLKFYAPNDCSKCKMGDISLHKSNKKQLFALPPEDLTNLTYKIQKDIYYPNGQVAFRIIEFR